MSLAKKLIEENLRTQNPELDLGNCGLDGSELLELLKKEDYRYLEVLYLGLTKIIDGIGTPSENNGNRNELKKFDFLEYLPNLKVLDIGENSLEAIPNEISLLTNLTHLYCSYGKITKIDFSVFEKLKKLSFVRLAKNNIKLIKTEMSLPQIITLDLSGNAISEMFFLAFLTNLTSLDLSNNQISDISYLTNLIHLQALYLERNKITYFPKEISFLPNLQELYLQKNNILNLPKKLYEIGDFDRRDFSEDFYTGNCVEEVRNYLLELEKGKIINETAKLIIVGNGRVGKTQIYNRLKGLPFNPDEKYTHGIRIGKLEKTHLPEAKTENLNLNVWDFGGQEIFYATHQFFLSDDAVYIFAWTKEKNVIPHRERDKASLPTEEKWQSLEYWLDTIRRHAPKSPVLVVQTHCGEGDKAEARLENEACKTYKIETQIEFDAEFGYNLPLAKKILTQKLNTLHDYGKKFPKTYENVILEIENRKNAGETIISYSEFVQTICRNANITEGGEGTLLEYLDKTGLVVHYRNHSVLKNHIYINLDWLTKQVYKLINKDLEKTESKITKEYLEKHLPDYESLGLLELFKKFDLIFEVKDEKETFWISPQYLNKECAPALYETIQEEIENDFYDKFIFKFTRFTPDNVMVNFISRYGGLSKKTYWKNGLRFTKKIDGKAVVCTVIHTPDNNYVEIYTSKVQKSKILLKQIVQAFSEFGKNAKTEISLDNQNFVSFQELKNDYEQGFQDIKSLQGNRLEIKDFWFLFEKNFETQSIETYNSMLQKILSLIDEVKINEVFTELDKANIQSPQINRLRQEFVHGRIDFDFYDRLKTAVRNELKVSQNSEQETMPINDSKSNQTQFWIQFLAEAKRRTNLFANKNPNPEKTARDGWMNTASGMTAVSFEVRIHKTYARVCLYINKPTEESKAIFDELHQSKVAIERGFGSTLAWERKEGKQHSRIDYALNIDTENEANWTKINDFLINNLVKLVQVLTPYLEQIKRSSKGEKEVGKAVNEPIIINHNPPILPDKIKILMLTANPAGTAQLNLDKEHSEIIRKLQNHLDKFAPIIKKAVNANEFKEETEIINPTILHFSGHGEKVTEELKELGVSENTSGIILQNDDKNGYEALTADMLEVLFEYFKDDKIDIRLVVLNACYSEDQAKIIANHIPYVVGTTKAIQNIQAIAFSTGFYFKISSNNFDIEQSFKSGRTEAAMKGAKKSDFVLFKNGQKLDI